MLSPFVKGLLSVQELSVCLKQLIKDSFPFVAVYGEISNLRNSNGITYFTLKDNASQIPVVLFKAEAVNVKSALKEGEAVIVEGRVDLYIASGRYQIIARNIRKLGMGILQQKFEDLKEKLRVEGLFSAERKLNVPNLPQHIGVITSPDAAALQDFLRIIKRKHWKGRITLAPSLVQGNMAPQSIQKAFNRLSKLPTIDLIVIIRGGGSFEDLNCFNNEVLIRFLAKRTKPLMTGIGHEVDHTLCDFVADLRAETPTAAAEIIANHYLQAQEDLIHVQSQLRNLSHIHWQSYQQRQQLLQQRFLAQSPQKHCREKQNLLQDLTGNLNLQLQQGINLKKSLFTQSIVALKHVPLKWKISQYKTEFSHISHRLKEAFQKHTKEKTQTFNRLTQRLDTLSLEKQLNRGVLFPLDATGKQLKSIDEFSINTCYHFLHASGKYQVLVQKKW